jgi:hypothetical protein
MRVTPCRFDSYYPHHLGDWRNWIAALRLGRSGRKIVGVRVPHRPLLGLIEYRSVRLVLNHESGVRLPVGPPPYVAVMEVGIHQQLKPVGPQGIGGSWPSGDTTLQRWRNGLRSGFKSRRASLI